MLESLNIAGTGPVNAPAFAGRESLEAAQSVVRDEKMRGFTVVLQVAPEDEQSADLLKQIRVTADAKEAAVLILTPSGRIVGTVGGATTKAALADAIVQGALAAPGGCCGGGAPKQGTLSGGAPLSEPAQSVGWEQGWGATSSWMKVRRRPIRGSWRRTTRPRT